MIQLVQSTIDHVISPLFFAVMYGYLYISIQLPLKAMLSLRTGAY